MVNQEYQVWIDFNIRNVFISVTDTSRYLYFTRSIEKKTKKTGQFSWMLAVYEKSIYVTQKAL